MNVKAMVFAIPVAPHIPFYPELKVGTPLWSYLENMEIDDKFVNKRVLLFEKKKVLRRKKILGRHNKDISLKVCWRSHPSKIAV